MITVRSSLLQFSQKLKSRRYRLKVVVLAICAITIITLTIIFALYDDSRRWLATGDGLSDGSLLNYVDELRQLIQIRPLVHNSTNKQSTKAVQSLYERPDTSVQRVLQSNTELRRIIHGTDHVDVSSTAHHLHDRGLVVNDRGLVLLFHPCGGSAHDWFELPEERRIVRYLLSMSLSVYAVSSDETCWSNSLDNKHSNVDLARVMHSLRSFCDDIYQSQCPPLFTISAAQGGEFASIINRVLPIVASVIYSSVGNERAWMLPSTIINDNDLIKPSINTIIDTSSLYPPPPVMFLHDISSRQSKHVKNMKDTAIKMSSRYTRPDSIVQRNVIPLPITSSFLTERVDMLSQDVSDQFYRFCMRESIIDASGFIQSEPQQVAKRFLLSLPSPTLTQLHHNASIILRSTRSNLSINQSINDLANSFYQSAIDEVLSVAWTHDHSLTSSFIDEVGWWMMTQLTTIDTSAT